MAGLFTVEMMVDGVWMTRFELMGDGSREPIDDDTWKRFDWMDVTVGLPRRGRVYRRGPELVDPDIF
jgi:hypothetical protein